MSDPTPQRRTIEDATCLGCACLCDDIGLVVERDRIVEARRACDRGRDWYANARDVGEVGSTVGGQPASLDQALDRAAGVLAGARSPVVLGLAGVTIDAQRVGLAIADRIGATLPDGSAWERAFQRLGSVGATLGEVRDRADLIVFDGGRSDFMPRFWERYVEPPGRFVPDGRRGRTIVWLGEYLAEPSPGRVDLPDQILPMARPTGYAILRALLAGASLDERAVLDSAGASLAAMTDLVGRLRGAKYGVFVLDETLPTRAVEAAVALVRDLNRTTHFVALLPPGRGSAWFAPSAVAAWQAGFEEAVDFALGHPRHVPRDGAVERLERDEADAILFLGDPENLRTVEGASDWSLRPPRVVIGPCRDQMPRPGEADRGDVLIPTARAGIDEGGTVARFDGVMLPLRPPFEPFHPRMIDVLRAIEGRLKASMGARP